MRSHSLFLGIPKQESLGGRNLRHPNTRLVTTLDFTFAFGISLLPSYAQTIRHKYLNKVMYSKSILGYLTTRVYDTSDVVTTFIIDTVYVEMVSKS